MHYKLYKSILSPKNGINLYRGCVHGCIYCDSRSKCYQMEHDFEDIEVKTDGPLLLEGEIRRKKNRCMIGTGSMCDPYQPIEKELLYTRKSLEIIEKYGFGATLITKSDLVLRDLDIIKAINEKSKCVIQMTMTTFDEELCKTLEPGVCTTGRRFEVLKILRDNGIPTIVWMCPFLPYINDTEDNLRGLLGYCFEAEVKGILNFGIGVTMRDGNRQYFYKALDKYFPEIKDKYIKHFGDSYECSSVNNDTLMRIFRQECRLHRVMCDITEIFKYLNDFPQDLHQQISLF